jgi:hypothetical protein
LVRVTKPNLVKITEDLKQKSEKMKEGTLFDQPKEPSAKQSVSNWVNKWRE